MVSSSLSLVRIPDKEVPVTVPGTGETITELASRLEDVSGRLGKLSGLVETLEDRVEKLESLTPGTWDARENRALWKRTKSEGETKNRRRDDATPCHRQAPQPGCRYRRSDIITPRLHQRVLF